MPSTALTEAIELVKTKRDELKSILDLARRSEDGQYDLEQVKSDKFPNPADDIKRIQRELDDASKKRDAQKTVEDADAQLKELEKVDESSRLPVGDPTGKGPVATKSLGQEFMESDIFKNLDLKQPSGEYVSDKTLKALFQTTAGFAPDSPRTDLVVPIVRRPIQLLDNIRQVPIALETFKYMEQTARSVVGTRLGVAEGAVYNEATFAYTERTVDIVKKGVYVEATEEQFDDVPMIENLLAQDLPVLIGEAIDEHLVNGPSHATEPEGLLNVSGTSTNAKEDDEAVMNALLGGIEEVEFTGRANADMVLMNTRDYYREMGRQDLNGRYIITDPNTAMTEFRPWGVRARKVDALPAGTAVVGDFGMYAIIRDRRDVRTRTSPAWSIAIPSGGNASTATTKPTGRVLIYTDVRLSWAWLRKAAFCKVTGLE